MGSNHPRRYRKIVLLPISVPTVDYCWDNVEICGYFDNTGGHSHCDLHLGDLKWDDEGLVLKPDKCLKLKDAE
jgi:hypothetical protein